MGVPIYEIVKVKISHDTVPVIGGFFTLRVHGTALKIKRVKKGLKRKSALPHGTVRFATLSL